MGWLIGNGLLTAVVLYLSYRQRLRVPSAYQSALCLALCFIVPNLVEQTAQPIIQHVGYYSALGYSLSLLPDAVSAVLYPIGFSVALFHYLSPQGPQKGWSRTILGIVMPLYVCSGTVVTFFLFEAARSYIEYDERLIYWHREMLLFWARLAAVGSVPLATSFSDWVRRARSYRHAGHVVGLGAGDASAKEA